jgi:hypothetical protein
VLALGVFLGSFCMRERGFDLGFYCLFSLTGAAAGAVGVLSAYASAGLALDFIAREGLLALLISFCIC